ncbi:tRNA 2-thiocytidine biosynthesis TtcA family protein [Acutalibacter sp.]|jgi:tRNA(Ile)-lysidine synthase TilS/MesJ|uniref:tRNA 2-thiocytidine biosynthesis TtcA family protein n=1 Tax=Acutalibacter sp. TaxID=1918636 RepID=UPI0021704DA2|nr:tRNA 2-thiocytidine biosynthesis protein TtcA [Acutalibacter sp.]
MTPAERAPWSLTKKYRKTIWAPFVAGIKTYQLLEEGDRVAVCVSGGKDSMLLAVLMRLLQRHSDFPFGLEFLAMDPGYSPQNRARLEANGTLLGLDLHIFETDVFQVADWAEKNPCYLCARMRRGHLYKRARELGCNKIALGHHFNDVIETTVLAMFYGAQLQCMPPKLHSANYPGMELIRPLYRVHEEAILAWMRYNELEFLQCACRFTEKAAPCGGSKRQEVKELLARLKETNPNIEKNVFQSLHAVCLDTFPGYKTSGGEHSFLEGYNAKGTR